MIINMAKFIFNINEGTTLCEHVHLQIVKFVKMYYGRIQDLIVENMIFQH